VEEIEGYETPTLEFVGEFEILELDQMAFFDPVDGSKAVFTALCETGSLVIEGFACGVAYKDVGGKAVEI